MYKFILIFLISLPILNSQEIKFFRLDADYINNFTLNNGQFLLTTNSQTCLIYDPVYEITKEYYTGLNDKNLIDTILKIEKVRAAEIKSNLLFISTDSSNRFINLVDNSILVDSSNNIAFSFVFLDKLSNIIGVKENGEIYKINVNANEIEYELIKKFDNPLSVFEYNDTTHILTIEGDIINYENKLTIGSILLPNKELINFSFSDNYFNLKFPNYYLKYDKNFNFKDSIFTNSYYYIPDEFGFYVPKRDIDTLRVLKFDEDNYLINYTSYYLPAELEIWQLNGVFSVNNKIISFGNNKFINSFDKEKNEINIKSIFKCADFPYLYLNKASFVNEKIGGVASSESSIYLTRDGGTTWNRFYEFDNMDNKNEFFHEIHLMSDSTFIAMGDGYSSTVYSRDFGKTYSKLSNPNTNEGFGSFFNKLNSNNYISIYNYNSTPDIGLVLSFQKINSEFDKIHSNYLQNLSHVNSSYIDGILKTVAVNYELNNKFYVIETDTNFSYFKYDSIGENIRYLNGIASFQNNFYLFAWDSTNQEQFLMKNQVGNDKWTKEITIKDNYMHNIYSQNNNLYAIDLNYTLYRINLEKLEFEYLAQLEVPKPFLTSLNIFDDVIYASYSTNFFKGIKIPEFNTNITNVTVEEIPTFSIYNPYPNPTNDVVKLKLDYDQIYSTNEILIDLYDIRGEKINSNLAYDILKISNSQVQINLDLNEQYTGIYFIKIIFGNKTEYVPIIKE